MKFIRASHISTYVKSPFLLWADVFADESDQDPEDAFQQLLIRRGFEHEENVITQGYEGAEQLVYEDAQEGFKQVLALMKEGVESISQAPIFLNKESLRGRPDLLVRVDGSSDFGDYQYVVKEIKYAKNIKQHHILQAAFYNKILADMQGVTSKEFILINHDAQEFSFCYKDYEELLEQTITAVRDIIDGRVVPKPIFGEDHPWKKLSKDIATQNQDISLLSGIGRSVRNSLAEKNISSLQELSRASKQDVTTVRGVGPKKYSKMMRQAEVILSGNEVIKSSPSFKQDVISIYFDIEGETQLDIDYLYGLLVDDEFVAFWADSPEQEEQVWRQFCSFLNSLNKEFVLYHYAPYERTSIKKLYLRYGCDEQLYKKIIHSLCDLHKVLKRSVVLPLTSYSIKPVAKWLDFSWRAEDASGANSMQWYQQYLDGDEDIKKKILAYNEDDVKATKIVHEYLRSLKN